MKLSFSQLENARQNPSKFGRRFRTGGGFFSNSNFRTYFVSAIRLFHQGKSAQQAVDHFEQLCTAKLSHLQHFEARLQHYKIVLMNYCRTFGKQKCEVVAIKRRVWLQVGNHLLGGIIERLDLRLPKGFRVTATEMERTDWRHQLRWPLIQKAIALEIGCLPAEVEIAVFSLDDGGYVSKTYSDSEIAQAEVETVSVLDEVEENLPEIE